LPDSFVQDTFGKFSFVSRTKFLSPHKNFALPNIIDLVVSIRDNVRVVGGAYGGFCTFSPSSGYFSYLSYRDPNLSKTLDVYDEAADALLAAADELEKDPDALATAIIGACGDLDKALSPDQKGWTAFERHLVNESPEYRQQYRDEILNTKPDDFRAFAERLRNMKDPSIAVISSKAAFEDAAKAGKEMSLTEVV